MKDARKQGQASRLDRCAALAGVVLITGACSTTIREMRVHHEPRATYLSPRSERALEGCLAAHLSWISQPAIIRGEGFTDLSFGPDANTVVMVTLRPQAAGTHVEVRQRLLYGARVRNNVEACVEGRD